MPQSIKKEHIEFGKDDKTIIKGEGGKALRNALIQKPAETFAELVQGKSIVRPSEISVDDDGKVVIDNPEFKKALQDRMNKVAAAGGVGGAGFFDTNCSCHKPT